MTPLIVVNDTGHNGKNNCDVSIMMQEPTTAISTEYHEAKKANTEIAGGNENQNTEIAGGNENQNAEIAGGNKKWRFSALTAAESPFLPELQIVTIL